MPHVTFGETYPTRRSYEESRAVVTIPRKKEDDKPATVLRRSRTISYKIAEEQPCRPAKPIDKTCIERKITYKDSKGNIIKITYEDSCGKVTKTIYPALPPPPQTKECRPLSPPPQKFESPPVSEPSNIPSEDVKNCDWTKIIVKNSRGVVWKVVHVDCHGKTMKTEYPEPEPPRRQFTETKRYLIKEIDSSSPPRRRYSETKKVVVDKEIDSSPPRKRCSETKKVVVDKEIRQPTPKSSSETVKVEKKYEVRSTVKSDDGSKRSEEPSESASASALPAPPPPVPSPPQESVTDSTITNRRDSVTNSSGKNSGESTREVVKDENGVVKKMIYTDSRGRRRTVVYDDDD